MGTLINQTGLSALDSPTHKRTHNLKQLLLSLFRLAIPSMLGSTRITQHTTHAAMSIYIRSFLILLIRIATKTQAHNLPPYGIRNEVDALKSLRSRLGCMKKLLKSFICLLPFIRASRHSQQIHLIKRKQKC